MWPEKIDAQLETTQKQLGLEKEACSTTAKLPKLIITPSKGTPTHWVSFANMFVTQVQNKSISAEEKFGFLLDMVNPNVQAKIANLKPGEIGYTIAWKRLKSKSGQSKLVVNTHVEGSKYMKIQEFYESVSRFYDAFLTVGEADMFRGLAMSTLNKLPQVRPDIVPTDENWENWDIEAMINNLQQLFRRHKVDDAPKGSGAVQSKREKWYSGERKYPVCIFCEGKHWADACEIVKTIEARRQFFQETEFVNCVCTGQ